MKLTGSVKGLVEGLRSNTSDQNPTRPFKRLNRRYHVVLSSAESDTLEEEAARCPEQEARTAAGRSQSASTATPGKNHSRSMAHATIAIHEDEDAIFQDSRCSQSSPVAKDMERRLSEDEVSVDGSFSDDSDESEEEVDETVIEDMRKLEESFKGISQKYRLINRIGEGMRVV